MLRDRITTAATSTNDHRAQTESIRSIAHEVAIATPPTSDICRQLLDALINNDHVSLVVSRQIVGELFQSLKCDSPADQQILVDVGQAILALVAPRLLSYEELASGVREKLAEIYEKRGEWRESAKMLAAIPYDSGQR